MNQLTKLIEQYEKETGGTARYGFYNDDFVLWLASRPTCGVEQRKFLDEIEKLELDDDGDLLYGILGHTIFQSQFKANLTEVQNGK